MAIDAFLVGRGGTVRIKGHVTPPRPCCVSWAPSALVPCSTLVLEGILPDHLLWNIEAPGHSAKLGESTTFAGTIIAAQRPKIAVRAYSTLQGALMSKRVLMGRSTVVEHMPFVPMLTNPSPVQPRLTIRNASLRFNRTGNAPIRAAEADRRAR